jgi:hypothetical protein
LSAPNALLLLDLDGVSALECRSGAGGRLEIMKLHDDMGAQLERFGCRIVVLTHRSRREALQILEAVGLADWDAENVVAAEQLLWARGRGMLKVLRDGLVKSAALSDIERRFGVHRRNMAIIDDRETNLVDLVDAGVGLGLMAPSEFDPSSNTIVSFDLSEALEIFTAWRAGASQTGRIQPLSPRAIDRTEDRRTGLNTRRHAAHPFNWTRYVARNARNFVLSLFRPRAIRGS